MKDHKVIAETVVFACCCALAAVAVMPGAWIIPATEIVLGFVVMCAVWASTGAAFLSLFWGTFGVTLGTWTVWASHRMWHVPTVFAWFVITAVAAPTAVHAVRKATPPPAPEPQPAPEISGLTPEQQKLANWSYMLEKAGCPGVETTEIRHERSGRIARLKLPREGQLQSIQTLRNAAHKIEIMMELREGAVSFHSGDHSADIWMRLRETEVLKDPVRLTPDRMAKTMNQKFAIGVQEDGNVAMITLRELHMLIVGLTGSGKSNLNNVLVAQLASMRDTLIWVIDMKGGRMARPWLAAWADGATPAPALDWVATTRTEAMLMMEAFNAVIDYRSNSGIGGSKITPSAEVPQIILICDEMADLFGQNKGRRDMVGEDQKTNTWFISMAETLTQKGRSEAVASVWATQRGTVTMAASGDFKANCNQRIALAAATANDARSVIPDQPHELKMLTSVSGQGLKGVGLITTGSNASFLTKFFWHDHIDGQCSDNGNDGCVPECPVWQSSIEVGKHRPALDKLSARALGDVYANRWTRSGNLLRRRTPAEANSGDTQVIDDSAIRESFAAIMEQGGVEDPDDKVDPARRRMREILIERGEKGSTALLLKQALEREGLNRARETIQRWLSLDAGLGLAHSMKDHGRWGAGPPPADEADDDSA